MPIQELVAAIREVLEEIEQFALAGEDRKAEEAVDRLRPLFKEYLARSSTRH